MESFREYGGLTGEEQRWVEPQEAAQVEKLGDILRDASLSDLDSLQKFGAFLQALNRKDYKTSSRALKRYWRRKELANKKEKGRRRPRPKRCR